MLRAIWFSQETNTNEKVAVWAYRVSSARTTREEFGWQTVLCLPVLCRSQPSRYIQIRSSHIYPEVML